MSISKRNKELGVQGARIVSVIGLLIGVPSLAVGLSLVVPGATYSSPEQPLVIERVKNHLATATNSNSVTVAEQQLSEVTTELDQYLKIHPLAKDSKDFQDWYRQVSRIKHRLTLARAVENSQADPLEKLQAEDIALKSLREFAEIKLTDLFGATLGTEYNVPNNIPIQLNAAQETIVNSWRVLIPVGIISLLLGLDRAVVSDEV